LPANILRTSRINDCGVCRRFAKLLPE
jgi:hypothetical protein